MQRTPVFPNLQISHDPVHRRRRGFLLVLVVLLITAGAGFGSWWFTAGRFTTVPSVTQVSEAVAIEAAAANSVNWDTRTEYSEDVAAGLVISTDPDGGTRVMRGDTIVMVISLGPERFTMPEVVGRTLEEASASLEDLNLVVAQVKETWSEDVPIGEVMSSSEDPGTALKRDTTINLTVSKGPEPIPIPDFADDKTSASSARKQLEKSGLTVEVTQENSDTVKKGLVISQSPSSGTGKRGDTIRIVESLGPVLVEIPDVRYKSMEDAKKLLQSVGFEVEVQYVTDFPLSLKIASGTEPGRGTSVPEGSTVILLVA